MNTQTRTKRAKQKAKEGRIKAGKHRGTEVIIKRAVMIADVQLAIKEAKGGIEGKTASVQRKRLKKQLSEAIDLCRDGKSQDEAMKVFEGGILTKAAGKVLDGLKTIQEKLDKDTTYRRK